MTLLKGQPQKKNQQAAIDNAVNPTAGNPFATIQDILDRLGSTFGEIPTEFISIGTPIICNEVEFTECLYDI